MRAGAPARRLALVSLLSWSVALPAAGAVSGRPEGCVDVAPGTGLRDALAGGAAALCLEDGVHQGPVRLTRPVTLWGGARAVVHSAGEGSTLSVEADGVVLQGFTVDGSGARFDLLDAAVRVRADDVRIEGLRVRGALFGILAERCRGLVLRGNEVRGDPRKTLGLRGDGIRLWEVRGARIEGNRLEDSRDLVVWYSPGNVFTGNHVLRGRYGTHFMYSHDNRVEASRYVENVVGIFAMYSRDLELRGNLIARSHGAAGVGIGAKDSGSLVVEDNALVGNTVGIYLDNSPLDPRETNRFRGNLLRFGESGIVFHGPSAGNRFLANRFAGQHRTVGVEGRGSALDAEWRGNDFDDYAGYDLDGDGVGDVPYVLRTLEGDLTARAPAARFFRGTAAMALVEWIGRSVPLFAPTTVLEDPAPAMRVPDPELGSGGVDAG